VTFEQSAQHKDYLNRAVEVLIRVGLVVLLVAACFQILRPFLSLIAWAIVVAIAVYPGYRKLEHLLGGRGRLAAVLCSLILMAVLILPFGLLTGTLVGGVQSLTARLRDGPLVIPAPPPAVAALPIIGPPLTRLWSAAFANFNGLLSGFAPQIKAIITGFLSASAGAAFTLLQFILSILVSGVLLANAEGAAKVSRSLANRLFGDQGGEFHELIGATIRSVTLGILGVAVIQSVLASVGFLILGLPSAGLWAVLFLVSAVIQVGFLVLIPAVIYAFAIMTTTKAIVFLVWCIIVGSIDNLLKALLLGRGARVPVAVVFLGAIGGFVELGIIGLFIGAIVLSVGYKVFLAWLNRTVAA